jgi:DNA-binding response OmpR family regulator
VLKPVHIDDVVARVEVQLRIAGYLKRRRVQAEALSRIAMVGAAAHELAQPLAGASGYLQLLQAGLERQTLDPAAYAERLGRIHSCLVKTRDIATRLEQLERVALEDYPCGAQIISLQESARPETARDPDDPRLVLLAAEAGVGRDAALERDLVLHGAELVREETVAEHAAEVDLVLLSCLDRLDHVKPVLERLATLWDTPHLLSPPVLALLPGQSIGRATPGVELLRSSVDDVLQRPFRLEELLIRIRSRVRLQRLRLGDLRLQSLGAAQDIRRRALDGFVEKVDHCLASLARLEARPDGLADLLAEYACQLDGLTGTVRRLQARNIPGFPEPAQG